MKTIDYVRWMGVAAWTCGLAIPRNTLGVSLSPSGSPGHISIECAGGCASTLEVIEREYAHIQWLLAGSPRDEEALEYVYHQNLRVTKDVTDRTFAVVDFSDSHSDQGPRAARNRDYSPEAALAAARDLSETEVGAALPEHIPDWPLAEPLGLLALAIREYFSHSVLFRLTQEYGKDLGSNPDQRPSSLAYGRLAYSVGPHPEQEQEPTQSAPPISDTGITLHVQARDPLFSETVIGELIERAQDFATAFGSTVDCPKFFHSVRVQSVFPSTIHEPDAEETPVMLYRIPLCTELLPAGSLPAVFSGEAVVGQWQPSVAEHGPSAREEENARASRVSASPDALTRAPMVLHRDPDSGVVEASRFTPGQTLVDRSIQYGGYLTPAEIIAELQRECTTAEPKGLAAYATPAMIWHSLATWGLSRDAWVGLGEGPVRALHPNRAALVADSIDQPLVAIEVDAGAPPGSAIHEVCDVLDALGVEPSTDFPIELVSSELSGHRTEVSAGSSAAQLFASDTSSVLQESDSAELPCLWPRALGARDPAVGDQALALAAVRQALHGHIPDGVSWVGVSYAQAGSPAQPSCIKAAVRYEAQSVDRAGFVEALSCALDDICRVHFPGAQVKHEILEASQLAGARDWVTAVGCHPECGYLPAYLQLERLS